MPRLNEVLDAIEASLGLDTAQDPQPGRNEWSGQCCVASLVLLDYFPGRLIRCNVVEFKRSTVHYYALLHEHGKVDATAGQFDWRFAEVMDIQVHVDPDLYWFDDTQRKYEILKGRVKLYLERNVTARTDENL